MSDAPLVYVIVLNYRNYDDTIACVRELRRTDYANFKILVVENGSDNESEARLREALPGVQIVQTGRNLGYSGGNNVGLRKAIEDHAEFAVILNPDTIVRPDFLTALVAHASADPGAGLLGALVLNTDGTVNGTCARRRPTLGEIFWVHGPGQWFGRKKVPGACEGLDGFERPLEVEVVSGACMMLRTSTLEQIGLLDDRSFLFWEEFILAEKLRATDYRTVLVPGSRVEHRGSGSMLTIRSRSAFFWLQSLGLYLRSYRGVGFLRRLLVMSGPTLFFLPGILKTAFGMRQRTS